MPNLPQLVCGDRAKELTGYAEERAQRRAMIHHKNGLRAQMTALSRMDPQLLRVIVNGHYA
ncbi:hypothetical protein, partial [Mycobacterium tuberculosis]|uniref:hypothetical protein n=1 Tax=Mycobacterium tuberculosis TaxID=1773 RepID=UPI001374C3A3